MMLVHNGIILRDFTASDIPKRIFWETKENEWQLWSSPWDYENLSSDEKKADLLDYEQFLEKSLESHEHLKDDDIRTGFQIDTDKGEYIGWINTYKIDDNYLENKDGHRLSIGITIPPIRKRDQGIGTQALTMYMDYLKSNGLKQVYLQTWSGNLPMISVAEKLGFTEICRHKDFHYVRGRHYDEITYRKDLD